MFCVADGPCLVLAGAGSGKTRTVTYRVAYLLENGVDPSRILLLTFTNKASRETLGRVQSPPGGGARGIWGGTFHFDRQSRTHAEQLDTLRFSILDQDDAHTAKAVMKEMSIDPKARRFPTAAVVQNILSYSTNTRTSVQDTLELHPHFFPFAGEIEEIRPSTGTQARAWRTPWISMTCSSTGPSSWRTRLALERHFRAVSIRPRRRIPGYEGVAGCDRGVRLRKSIGICSSSAMMRTVPRRSAGADVKNILRFPEDWRTRRFLNC